MIILILHSDLTVKSEQGTAKDMAYSYNQAKIALLLDAVTQKEKQTRLEPSLWLNVFSFLPPKVFAQLHEYAKSGEDLATMMQFGNRNALRFYQLQKLPLCNSFIRATFLEKV